MESSPAGRLERDACFVLPEAMHVVDKPWGREVWWALTDRYLAKRIEVAAGQAMSLQYHERKLETIYVLSGRTRFTVGEAVLEPAPGSAVTLQPGTIHRVEAIEDTVLFEVSTPDAEDVVRLEDRYGRTG